MDGGQGSLPPNLADILSTLSRFAPQSNPILHSAEAPSAGLSGTSTNGAYDPTAPQINGDTTNSRSAPPPQNQVIDPATIIEWSAGLRCISKTSMQNANFGYAVKSMIGNQRRNELDWYSRRQELKKLQAQRGIGSNELSSIMKSIGAPISGVPQKQQSPAQMQAELDEFDLKIYRAQCQMTEAMAVELKALGVPFFGTASDRLVPEDKASNADAEQPADSKWSPRISHSELRALQRRMISYLEDMYKD